MKPRDKDEELNALLRAWSDVPAPDTSLARNVERVVGENAGSARRTPWWLRGRDALGLLATWPRLACVGVAAGVLLGIGVAEWSRWRERAELPARYLQWIDPTSAPVVRVSRS